MYTQRLKSNNRMWMYNSTTKRLCNLIIIVNYDLFVMINLLLQCSFTESIFMYEQKHQWKKICKSKKDLDSEKCTKIYYLLLLFLDLYKEKIKNVVR